MDSVPLFIQGYDTVLEMREQSSQVTISPSLRVREHGLYYSSLPFSPQMYTKSVLNMWSQSLRAGQPVRTS